MRGSNPSPPLPLGGSAGQKPHDEDDRRDDEQEPEQLAQQDASADREDDQKDEKKEQKAGHRISLCSGRAFIPHEALSPHARAMIVL